MEYVKKQSYLKMSSNKRLIMAVAGFMLATVTIGAIAQPPFGGRDDTAFVLQNGENAGWKIGFSGIDADFAYNSALIPQGAEHETSR